MIFRMARLLRIGRLGMKLLVPLTVLLALGVALIFFLFPAADLWFVWKVYRRFVDTIANATGLNAYLVTAGALLVFVAFYRGVSLVLYHPFNSRKRWIGIGLLLLIALAYNLTLYAATKDASFGFQSGTASKYYAITPIGVRFFDRPGVDPNYGIRLQPVTPENIRNLELLRQGAFVPVDPMAARFFNPITGKAELWYTKDEAGEFTFFDKPGFDPKMGTELQPVTEAIYRAWKKAQDDAEKKRRAAEEEAERQRRAALSEKARREEDAAKARRAAEDRRIAAVLDCKIEAEQRHKNDRAKLPESRPSQEGIVGYTIGQGQVVWANTIAFATSSFTNVAPRYLDALHEKCVQEAERATR